MNIYNHHVDAKLQENIENIIVTILKYRKKSNLTQEQVSEQSGISRTTISRIESFSIQPDLQTLMQICDVFDLDLEIVIKPRQQEK